MRSSRSLAHFACVWRRNIEIPTLRKWEHSARQQSSTTTHLKLPIWCATKRLHIPLVALKTATTQPSRFASKTTSSYTPSATSSRRLHGFTKCPDFRTLRPPILTIDEINRCACDNRQKEMRRQASLWDTRYRRGP